MSLRNIADIAGVSISTVSRVVNDTHRDKVSEGTRQRILEIARSMNYRPNPEAVALKTRRRTTTVGMLIPYYSHIFRGFYWSEISCGVLDGARALGVDVNMMVYHDESEETFAGLLSSHRNVAGVIIMGIHPAGHPAIDVCRKRMLPFVVINNNGADPDADSVDCDNRAGGYNATRHLIRLGHRRIAHIAGKDFPDANARRQGFCDAMDEAGLPVDEGLVVAGAFEEAGGREAMRALLSRPRRPTAVFAANDQSAIGAMTVIRSAGYRIPDDIAVVGFDDILLAQYVDPALTTIHQPIYRMGCRAAEILVGRVKGANGDGSASAERHAVRTRLVVRESCGASRVTDRHKAN